MQVRRCATRFPTAGGVMDAAIPGIFEVVIGCRHRIHSAPWLATAIAIVDGALVALSVASAVYFLGCSVELAPWW